MTSHRRLLDPVRRLRRKLAGPPDKADAEMAYWRERKRAEGELGHEHYEAFYTEAFGLGRDDYAGKRVLDVGCGPRGTLEWADMAAERIGLDPLVERYRELGIDDHAMTYVAAGAERIPFADGHFDIVVAFNALDHVDDVDAAIAELTRVTRTGGTGLVLVEVNHRPTATEPHALELDFLARFTRWRVEFSDRTGIDERHWLYDSWRDRLPWTAGPALIGARMTRV